MLTIHGRRWFERRNGNTYHSVHVYDGKTLVGEVKFTYGYGDQYRQTAFEIVTKARPDLYSNERRANGTEIDYGRFCQENQFFVTDVARKKDL